MMEEFLPLLWAGCRQVCVMYLLSIRMNKRLLFSMQKEEIVAF